jgi:hypothetical protein
VTEQPQEPQDKKPRRITRKQAKLARERVKDPEATLPELAQRADYSDKSNVKRALDLPQVQQKVRELLAANPKTDLAALTKKLEEGLEATETRLFADKGVIMDERELPDYSTRHKYMETAYQLHGAKDKSIADVPQGVAQILNIIIQARQERGINPTELPNA